MWRPEYKHCVPRMLELILPPEDSVNRLQDEAQELRDEFDVWISELYDAGMRAIAEPGPLLSVPKTPSTKRKLRSKANQRSKLNMVYEDQPLRINLRDNEQRLLNFDGLNGDSGGTEGATSEADPDPYRITISSAPADDSDRKTNAKKSTTKQKKRGRGRTKKRSSSTPQVHDTTTDDDSANRPVNNRSQNALKTNNVDNDQRLNSPRLRMSNAGVASKLDNATVAPQIVDNNETVVIVNSVRRSSRNNRLIDGTVNDGIVLKTVTSSVNAIVIESAVVRSPKRKSKRRSSNIVAVSDTEAIATIADASQSNNLKADCRTTRRTTLRRTMTTIVESPKKRVKHSEGPLINTDDEDTNVLSPTHRCSYPSSGGFSGFTPVADKTLHLVLSADSSGPDSDHRPAVHPLTSNDVIVDDVVPEQMMNMESNVDVVPKRTSNLQPGGGISKRISRASIANANRRSTNNHRLSTNTVRKSKNNVALQLAYTLYRNDMESEDIPTAAPLAVPEDTGGYLEARRASDEEIQNISANQPSVVVDDCRDDGAEPIQNKSADVIPASPEAKTPAMTRTKTRVKKTITEPQPSPRSGGAKFAKPVTIPTKPPVRTKPKQQLGNVGPSPSTSNSVDVEVPATRSKARKVIASKARQFLDALTVSSSKPPKTPKNKFSTNNILTKGLFQPASTLSRTGSVSRITPMKSVDRSSQLRVIDSRAQQASTKKDEMIRNRIAETKRKREERIEAVKNKKKQLEQSKKERPLAVQPKPVEKSHGKTLQTIRREAAEQKRRELELEKQKNEAVAEKASASTKSFTVLSAHQNTYQQQPSTSKAIAKPTPITVAAYSANVSASSSAANTSCYDMTPQRVPAPSTAENYNIDDLMSDDETDDESKPRKKIPTWAQGSQLKSALIRQFYDAIDLDTIFPAFILPNLAIIFDKGKPTSKYNKKRNSSAVWHSPLPTSLN